ncbi:MAG: hypothetical protein ABGX04_07295 [Myxococcales bacterium]
MASHSSYPTSNKFSAQEGQHDRQHTLLNDSIRLQGFEALTTASARFFFERQSDDEMLPSVNALFQWHMSRFISRVTRYMLEADPSAVERCGGKEGLRARRKALGPDLRKIFLPKLLKTYSPWYTPHDIP